MIEATGDTAMRAGMMETPILHPDRDSPHPIVFLLMDATGIHEELRDIARRLCAVAPNLYHRAGKPTKYGSNVTSKGSGEQAVFYPHTPRHSYGSVMAGRGQDLRLIQDDLGHRDPRHTVHYTGTAERRFKGLWR